MNIDKFIELNKLTANVEEVGENPNMDDPKWQARHYKVTIFSLKDGRKYMTTYFSQGMGIEREPELRDVLDCLANDAQTDGTFEDFCATYGYDTDSRNAERIYKAVIRNSNKLKRLLGENAYNQVVHEVERL